jgi:hypothetical protein
VSLLKVSQSIDAVTFSFVTNHFGSDLDADELKLNLAMLPGICIVCNLPGKPSVVNALICDAVNAFAVQPIKYAHNKTCLFAHFF